MRCALAVGGPGPVLPVRWDFTLPLYLVLSFVLAIAIARARPTAWTALTSFAAANVWKWSASAFGVAPAASLAFLLASALRTIRSTRRSAEGG